MEMNVSKNDEQVVAKKKGGLNPAIVIPILFVIGVAIYMFVLGNPSNFQHPDQFKGAASVALSDVEGKKIEPAEGSMMGIVYKGGPVVPILLTFMITVLVFSIERALVLGRASGKNNLDNFVTTIRTHLNKNQINEALEECDRQQGSVGNVVKEGLTTYKILEKDATLNKEQKLVALSKSLEEATTLEMPMLEKNMMILSTLGTVATLIALLGTVLGMIKAFAALGAGGGSPDAAALSTGISEALINTALGIGTSAIAIILYNYFTSKIDGLTYKIDEIGLSIQQSFAEFN
ncbi:MotA/TolQ/ExbB proton channel family protein [Chryseobacterium caseinilyticum]|uniref:MotA/TolQ/ExbB proton channel family protein n=1 Tax=Chryseobacterium caseinilyticum TaxID=2771428 RepID=A0ABR8ZES4_9FLAO|nr:MotA/TolQ/ExbB proton channel family protein [Chryseobacterium caseinilyticum]MBD8083775.1 MotA/TolQ/ExbB proton channel family protein [Chryseobacterium caseinilyticum]